jgi:hypothetical protein
VAKAQQRIRNRAMYPFEHSAGQADLVSSESPGLAGADPADGGGTCAIKPSAARRRPANGREEFVTICENAQSRRESSQSTA